jgi:hypothetical protein
MYEAVSLMQPARVSGTSNNIRLRAADFIPVSVDFNISS